MTISTLGSQLSNIHLLGMLRQKLNTVQAQASSGKKGFMLSDLGGSGSVSALGYRNGMNMVGTYIANLNVVKTRVTTMDKAMQNVADSARDTLTTLRKQIQSNEPFNDMNKAESAEGLRNILAKLNIKLNDRYLFSGSDIENPPMSDPSALNSNISSTISTLMAGTPTKDDVIAALRGVAGNDLGFSTGSLSSDAVTFRADDGRDIDYTVRAHNDGFSDILRGMAVISNMPTPTTDAEKEKYWTVVNAAMDLLDQGARTIDSTQGKLGNQSKTITNLIATHEDMRLTMETYIGSVEDVDIADASTRLQQLQAQLQISYNITSSMKDLSLVNFIR